VSVIQVDPCSCRSPDIVRKFRHGPCQKAIGAKGFSIVIERYGLLSASSGLAFLMAAAFASFALSSIPNVRIVPAVLGSENATFTGTLRAR
jgi:hypothetical protein